VNKLWQYLTDGCGREMVTGASSSNFIFGFQQLALKRLKNRLKKAG